MHQVRDSYHQNLLWIGHQPGIKTRLTALENLHFYHRDGDTAQCLEALAQAGLAGFEDIPVNQLSAGQQRRVALASVVDPCHVMDTDEPLPRLTLTASIV